MKIPDKKLWPDYFDRYDTPKWSCSKCSQGILKPINDKFSIEETEESKEFREKNPDIWEEEWLDFLFTGFFSCSNSSCKNMATMSGYAKPAYRYSKDNGVFQDFDFYPSSFKPSPAIIDIPPECSEDFKKAIKSSFDLFWADNDACANRIRASIEILLDDLKVQKTKDRKNRLLLHARLEKIKQKNLAAYNSLLAIKWIGNFGSHQLKITRGDLLDSYLLLYHALDEIYLKTSDKIRKLATTINKHKKPLSTKKNKKK